MIKAVLFDLDGTIINSEEGITKCVQYALSSFGIEEPDRKKLLCFIGPPLDPVFREKYGFDADKAWQAVLKYRERFDKTGIFECELYEGVADTIRKLKEAGIHHRTCFLQAGDSVQTHSGTFFPDIVF